MACKKCGDPEIDSHYKCHSCNADTGTFKWCVITKAKKEEGNLYHDIIKNKRCTYGTQIIQLQNFTQGEIFPIEPNFEREMCARSRNPSKWAVEYEVFPSRNYKQAILRAIQATKESYKEPDNLDYLQEQYEKLLKKNRKEQNNVAQ